MKKLPNSYLSGTLTSGYGGGATVHLHFFSVDEAEQWFNGLTAEAAEQREQGQAVRFCPECGSIGEVPEGFRDCCPDGSHARYVHPVIADMAQGGFHAMLNSLAAPPTPPAGVLDEFVLVPVEPTDEMRDAGNEIILDRGKLFRAWRAMLSAAPQPAAQTQETTNAKTKAS